MRAIHRNIGGAFRDRSGAALIEAAMVFPVLISLGFGAFDFSNYFYQHQAVVTGVRDAARYLARNSCATATPSAPPATACATQIADAAQIAVYGDIGGTTPRVANWSAREITVTYTAIANASSASTGEPTYRGGNPIYTVDVSTSFSYQQIGFLTMLGLGNPTISASHTERVIGG